MSVYADTSFFVSVYLTDLHTKEAERRLASRPVLWITPLHDAEWTHAIELHVFRKAISRSEADRLRQQFHKHREQGIWRYSAFPDQAWRVCAQLAERHAARLGIRTLDTLHVACAVEFKAGEFWTFDQRQERLAQAAGLKTD